MKIVLDIDGCIANFERAFCKEFGYNRRYFVNLEKRYPNKVKEIRRFVQDSRIYANLELIPLGREIARFFTERLYDINILSARPFHTSCKTYKWLKKHQVPYHYTDIQSRVPKIKKIEQLKPHFVIDDFLSICEPASNDLDIPSFLINQPWNQKDNLPGNVHRINDFSEFLQVFRDFY